MESFIILFFKSTKSDIFTAAFLYSRRCEMTSQDTLGNSEVVMLLSGQLAILAILAICTEHYTYYWRVSEGIFRA